MQKWVNSSGTATYFSWRNMRSRCYNINDIGFHNYGGRGIVVCKRWREDYDAFVEDMGIRPDGLTLDRIDGNGNYEKSNCRWTDYITQANNRTKFNTYIEFEGRKQTLAQWARELEISLELFCWRLSKWSPDKAMQKGRINNWAPGKHGTISTYTRLKCRCDPCKEAKRQSRKPKDDR
jgi:hypothetical protein